MICASQHVWVNVQRLTRSAVASMEVGGYSQVWEVSPESGRIENDSGREGFATLGYAI
ncbi:protein of unknown function [Nocardia cyriacigeorgica GUH-2]|uniref:Uncharacterized protein n=1 Tax=Nocardia cyriacigeorgica (strain GUH-2) TaxID=1127134 RepID=H6RD63_NOCCG|nr:protein of unknown function [Nocardia cyriacigeorgica GUH-2]